MNEFSSEWRYLFSNQNEWRFKHLLFKFSITISALQLHRWSVSLSQNWKYVAGLKIHLFVVLATIMFYHHSDTFRKTYKKNNSHNCVIKWISHAPTEILLPIHVVRKFTLSPQFALVMETSWNDINFLYHCLHDIITKRFSARM